MRFAVWIAFDPWAKSLLTGLSLCALVAQRLDCLSDAIYPRETYRSSVAAHSCMVGKPALVAQSTGDFENSQLSTGPVRPKLNVDLPVKSAP